MDSELAQAVNTLKLKLRAAKHLLRDLTAAAGHVEDLLQATENAEPKEAERDPNEDPARYCAAA